MEEKTNALFHRIQAFAAAGKDINRFYDDRAVLDGFLDSYYQHELCAVHEDEAFNKMLLLSLNQRAYPIQEQLDWLLSHGADINDGGEDRPLMNAVSVLDAPMAQTRCITIQKRRSFPMGAEITTSTIWISGFWMRAFPVTKTRMYSGAH